MGGGWRVIRKKKLNKEAGSLAIYMVRRGGLTEIFPTYFSPPPPPPLYINNDRSLTHRLSKRQSLSTTKVLFRAMFPRTIVINLLMT